MMTNLELMRLDARIAHYRLLQREVTDSLAVCLLNSVILELECERKTPSDTILTERLPPGWTQRGDSQNTEDQSML
jgi:hypothetical protein